MTAALIIVVLAGVVWLSIRGVRKSSDRQRRVRTEQARANTAYMHQRAEFLATASPVEAQEFLIQEQTHALIEAQRRNTVALGLMVLLAGSQSPVGNR